MGILVLGRAAARGAGPAPVPSAASKTQPDSTTTPVPSRTVTFALSAGLFITLSPLIFAGLLEWEYYRANYWRGDLSPGWHDRILLLWLLWWKTAILLAVPWAAALCLAWRRWGRAAQATLLVGWSAVIFWLAVDLRVQETIGTHALAFLPFVQDALAMLFTANHTEWGGGNGALFLEALLVLLAVITGGLALWFATRSGASRAAARWPEVGSARAAWCVSGTLLLALLGFVPGQALVHNSLTLRQTKAAIPVETAWIDPLTASFSRLCGLDGRNSQSVAVRIVSLLPNPAGEDKGNEQVHLHNFTPQAVSLSGWRLIDNRGHELRLSGVVPADQTLVVTLPDGPLKLNNHGDCVRLLDHRGVQIHQASYNHAKYGALLTIRDARDFDDFELRVNTAAQKTYQRYFPELFRSRPADPAATVRSESLPNVVYLVLESFRDAAVSPEVMGRLDAWGRGGLRFRRHYAGSNSSHFGLFGLLYSRSSLVYEPTLDAKTPPQTVLSLKNSGYECYFITSGNCYGFRRMGEFLSEDYFEQVVVQEGQSWRDWAQRDRRTLQRVRQLALERTDKPRFIMCFLMSTHFPYSFPEEFDHFRPSGDDVSRPNWRMMPPEVLHNRYRNAARYLEAQMLEVIEALDPQRNLILLTGDHGESMFEDGALAHATRGSEVQTRVPLLMVGPRIPAREITQPTTHTDVLPTLLHALAGREVPIRHIHGRDVLAATELGEEVLLCPYRARNPYDLILIRGGERLQFKIRLDKPEIAMFGFCDEAANLDLSGQHDCSPGAARAWAGALWRQFGRVVR
jgi:hypothetical protein